MAEEDIRQVELSTIAAIYPELQIDENDPHTISLELPVSLANPVTVRFPAATEGAPPAEQEQGQEAPAGVAAVDSHALSHLPSLQVRIELPDGYPLEKPPKVGLSTSPPWLSEDILRKLESDVDFLWEEIGRDQVVFTYIDNLQQSTENIFSLVDDEGCLDVGPEHKIAILDHDIKAKQRAFERETFDCGICLEPKKGAVCHRMLDCGHVFCVQCLQDFYNNAITEGDISSVQCLEPNCVKEREDAVKGSVRKKKAKTFINPSELLQIPLERDMVKRYVTLKHKSELESDKNTVYCPRSWCQGAARSRKHKKPEGLEFAEASEEESDAEDEVVDDQAKYKPQYNITQELLAICEDCNFAFCTRCEQSWHGEFTHCRPKIRTYEITEEEKASLEYLRMHTTECPTCAAPCQKTHGCNHMRCFKCMTHFCYLCSAWLDPSNPYQHFNVQPSGEQTGCYMRLWELEEGDGEGVGQNFEGRAPRDANAAPAEDDQRRRGQRDVGDRANDPVGGEAPVGAPGQQPPNLGQPRMGQPNGRIAVAREGPLVLRIEGGNAPPPQAPPAPQAAAQAQAQAPAVQAPQPAIPDIRREGYNAFAVGRHMAAEFRRRREADGMNRQNNNRNRPQGQQQQQQQNQRINNNGRNGQNRMRNGDGDGDMLRGNVQLNAADMAWIQHVVQRALNDQEDLVEVER
ncbi:hypothetical protein M426DRAFT_317720 [Hypoxylon sp. CI-4A]|nr:hypothetical protein M426DRAFT_317720 [Hypoxylon sp. CI-4A]